MAGAVGETLPAENPSALATLLDERRARSCDGPEQSLDDEATRRGVAAKNAEW